ncbi:ImmA/IrrE family metallo-endopeptidase [Lysinibacillus sphaericus]|uniref:ImmA/IrrE family metallo-endopeptidase n=1 Tax=Lysinibacillus sphaericus TaxID=1421 RepID=UPI000C17B67E|nr:ImmA/IrrE family metallo-endopeptidase [Lysinibacillus sphaericus]MEB7455094.1 ImmA/IrrE family metallo-endopeptidase [Lysinibacillus sphaericus]PIJ97892.1 ImmA/IrrE family metallo-endopeptidase [Lysinibacillus sphaericus]
MDIKMIIGQLVKKYGTSNPFKLADLLGILIVFEPLGSIYGYYSRSHRTKVIHINEFLPHNKQFSTCAHELGHALLHPNENTAFLKKNTLLSTEKIEIEANTFAVELLLPDELFTDQIFSGFTIYDAIEEKGVPFELLSLKRIDGKKILP